MSELIVLENVSKDYRRGREAVHALRDVTETIAAGEFVAVVGPSGSGKTTLLQLLGCVDRPTRGRVILDGAEINGLGDTSLTRLRARTVGFVFQQFFLLPTLTAQENVELPGLFAGNKQRTSRAHALLERLGLENRASHRPGELSGGEMQRVAVARALINSPKILLADEPTGNLDSANAEAILDLFGELNREGQTILMVTHNAELAARANRILRLRDGRIVRDK